MAKVTKEEAQAERRALTAKLKQLVFAMYDCKCAVCGYTNNPEFVVTQERIISGKLSANGNAIHHVKPVSLGGKTVPDNLILLCPTHHKEAHDFIINCEDYIIREDSLKLRGLDFQTLYEIRHPALKPPKLRHPVSKFRRSTSKFKHPKGKLTWQGSWIKPSEALPQKGEWVLIYYNNAVEQGVKLAKWTGENFLRNPYFNYDFNKIDYWMSLSEIGKFKSVLPVEDEEVLIWYKYPFESEANIKLLKWAKDNQYSDFITGWIPLPDPLLGLSLRSDAK